MPPRRASAGFKIGVLGACLAAGTFLTAAPQTGTQSSGKGVQVPSIGVPRVPVPAVGAPRTPAPPRPTLEQMGSRRLTAARAEAFVQAARRGLDYLPGEVLVKFKPGMGPADQNRALMALRARPTSDSLEWRGEVAIVRDDGQWNAYILADQLRSQPEVEYAEPNFIAKIDPLVREVADNVTSPGRLFPTRGSGGGRVNGVPTDADYIAYQWNFSLINMPSAWDLQPGGRSDLIVAVLDTGITGAATNMTFPLWTGSSFQNVSMPYAVNPDLPASRHVLPRDYAFLDPLGPVVDMDGHGTHVSSTIGEATNNGLLVAGIAYNVRIMPIKVCTGYWEVMVARAQIGQTGFAPTDAGGCSFADIADGLRYAVDNGARVMNISIGGTSQSTTLQSALAYAVSQGAFISVSMGNRFETGNQTSYPAAYASGIDGVMSVASIGFNQVKAYYSSTGPHCEIAAPGGDSRSGAGRLDSGVIWQSTLLSGDVSPFLTMPRFDRYNRVGYQGTSMASPHVAGLAALLMSQMPNATPAFIERIIRASALDLGATGRDESFGFGRIQPRKALYGGGIR